MVKTLLNNTVTVFWLCFEVEHNYSDLGGDPLHVSIELKPDHRLNPLNSISVLFAQRNRLNYKEERSNITLVVPGWWDNKMGGKKDPMHRRKKCKREVKRNGFTSSNTNKMFITNLRIVYVPISTRECTFLIIKSPLFIVVCNLFQTKGCSIVNHPFCLFIVFVKERSQ